MIAHASAEDKQRGGITLYEFISKERFTGIVRGVDIMSGPNFRVVSKYAAVFRRSELEALSAVTVVFDGSAVHELALSQASGGMSVALRELILKLLLKPVSQLELVSYENLDASALNEQGHFVAVDRELWSTAKALARSIISSAQR